MKKIVLLIILIYPFLPLVSQTKFSQTKVEKIGELMNQQEYFKLKRELDKTDDSEVGAIMWNMANALVNTFFNNPKEAVDNIVILLNNYQSDIGAENIVSMLNLLIENYTNMREYAVAAALSESLMSQFSASKELYTLYEKSQKYYSALSTMPKQDIDATDKSVRFVRDHAGLIIIPVKDNNGKEHNFVLDTGAGTSLIPESLVSDFNIDVIVDSVNVHGVGEALGKLGVSNRIFIGDLSAENVLFAILPDSILSTKYEGREVYKINGIIGWDFVRDLKNLSIDNRSEVILFNTNTTTTISNLKVSSLRPSIEAVSETDTLIFYLDTGANTSSLTSRNFPKYQSRIVTSEESLYKAGGIGGRVVEEKAYSLPDFPLKIGQKILLIPSIDVDIKDLDLFVGLDGVIGQDIISLCDIFFIDLSTMSVNMISN